MTYLLLLLAFVGAVFVLGTARDWLRTARRHNNGLIKIIT